MLCKRVMARLAIWFSSFAIARDRSQCQELPSKGLLAQGWCVIISIAHEGEWARESISNHHMSADGTIDTSIHAHLVPILMVFDSQALASSLGTAPASWVANIIPIAKGTTRHPESICRWRSDLRARFAVIAPTNIKSGHPHQLLSFLDSEKLVWYSLRLIATGRSRSAKERAADNEGKGRHQAWQ
jgi:hypothetical protein